MTPSEIAGRLRSDVETDGLLEPTIYYRVQRDCLAAADGRPVPSSIILHESARLAERLAIALECGGIEADHLLLWRRYAAELERAIRLADSTLPAGDLLVALQHCMEIIGSPRGAAG